MTEGDRSPGLAGLTVPLVGSVVETEDPFLPYQLVNFAGEPVMPVTEFR